MASLERAWEAIVARHPEVPPAPGQGHPREGLKLGHFAAGRWEVGGTDRAEVLSTERHRRVGELLAQFEQLCAELRSVLAGQ